MDRRDGLVTLLLSGLLLAACDADDDDSGATVDVTASTTASTPNGQDESTVPSATAELVVDLSAGGDELTVQYGGRLAGQRWPFAEVYRRPDNGTPDVLVGWLLLGDDGGSFLRYSGRPFTRREGTTHGGPGPETYPLELPPGNYRVCAEVVPRVDVTEVVCTDFSISG